MEAVVASIPAFSWKTRKILHETSVRLDHVSVKNQPEHLLNMNIITTAQIRLLLRYCDVTTNGVWDIGFLDHLEVVTTNNYNTMADFHTLQISTAHALFSPACSVFSRRYNNGYSSAEALFERRFPSFL
jgi:hypothetical protein